MGGGEWLESVSAIAALASFETFIASALERFVHGLAAWDIVSALCRASSMLSVKHSCPRFPGYTIQFNTSALITCPRH